MADTTEDPGPGAPAGRPRWWIAAGTFVLGVVAGILLVGLLSTGTPDFVQASREAAEDAPTPAGPAGVPVAAQAEVNAACLRVINGAQDVSRILSGVDEAAGDIDLQRLDDIVRQLQPLEQRLQQDLAECRVDPVSVQEPTPAAPSTPPPAQPTPSPSGETEPPVPTAAPS